VDPCVPPDWKEFRIRRPFRNAVYDVEVTNPDGVEKGVARLEVDGEPIDGTLLPAYGDGRTHYVKATMGPRR
jgi:cellobiose phosphorylase